MALYAKFRYTKERLRLRVSKLEGNVVVGRVWNHPVNRGLLFDQVVGIPIVDVIDNMYIISEDL